MLDEIYFFLNLCYFGLFVVEFARAGPARITM